MDLERLILIAAWIVIIFGAAWLSWGIWALVSGR